MTNNVYDNGPFKLICDDLGLANMIVRSEDDLTIVGVVDFEWVYAGPAQLFASAPWWLLIDPPVNDDWDFDGEEPAKCCRPLLQTPQALQSSPRRGRVEDDRERQGHKETL